MTITIDTNAPGSWAWTDVQNLDCDVIYDQDSAGGSVSKVEVRITYGVATPTPSVTPSATPTTSPSPTPSSTPTPTPTPLTTPSPSITPTPTTAPGSEYVHTGTTLGTQLGYGWDATDFWRVVVSSAGELILRTSAGGFTAYTQTEMKSHEGTTLGTQLIYGEDPSGNLIRVKVTADGKLITK